MMMMMMMTMMLQMCSWAVNATNFVSQLRPSKDLTIDELDQLVASIDRYLSEHPVVSSQLVSSTLDTCVMLNNDRLTQQCTSANVKCQEAFQLINVRRVSTTTVDPHR